jgi:hypothetical protein
LPLLTYLSGHYISAILIKAISPCIVVGPDDPVEPAIYELYRTVVFDRDSDATGFPNHFPEVSSPGNSSRHTVVMGAMNTLDQP